MFKKFTLAVLPALLFTVNLFAADDLSSVVANFEAAQSGASEIKANVAKEDALGKADVDALLGEKRVDEKDAIAACFRGSRGHGSYGHSHGSYGCYTSSYSSCYYPNYCSYDTWYPSTSCYTPSYCNTYTPSYCTNYTPTYCTTYTPTTYTTYKPTTYTTYTPVTYTTYTPNYCTSYEPTWQSSCWTPSWNSCSDWGWSNSGHCHSGTVLYGR